MKRIFLILAILSRFATAQVTHQSPTLDRNNTWTGTNTFSGGFNTAGNLNVGGTFGVTGTSTFNAPINSTANNTWSGLNAFSATGVFTSGQGNYLLQSLLNSCNPTSEWHLVNANNAIFTTDAVSGCVTVPNTANVFQANGVAAYISSASTSTNAVGGYFSARAAANGVTVWGANPIATDGGFTSTNVVAIEADTNATSTTTNVQGVQCNGSFTAQPTSAICLHITKPQGTGKYTAGIVSDSGASTDIFAQLGANSTSNSSPSQRIGFVSLNSSGVGKESYIGTDLNGSMQLSIQSGAGLGIGNGAVTPRGIAEVSTGGSVPDALNANISSNVNITDGGNTGIQLGFADSGGLRGFIQARNNVGANNTAYPLSLNELGGGVKIGGGSTVNAVYNGSATLTYTSIAAQTSQEQTMTITGASTTNFGVFCSPRATLGNANVSWSAWVSATNTVSVRVTNPTTGAVTPSAVAWGCTVNQ